MNIFKKIFNWFKNKRKQDDENLSEDISEDLSEILFDSNFKSGGIRPNYNKIEFAVFSVDDNLRENKNKYYVKTLKYDEIKFMTHNAKTTNVCMSDKKINKKFESSSEEQKGEYIRQFNKIKNFDK